MATIELQLSTAVSELPDFSHSEEKGECLLILAAG